MSVTLDLVSILGHFSRVPEMMRTLEAPNADTNIASLTEKVLGQIEASRAALQKLCKGLKKSDLVTAKSMSSAIISPSPQNSNAQGVDRLLGLISVFRDLATSRISSPNIEFVKEKAQAAYELLFETLAKFISPAPNAKAA
jgi:hypothetical protein